MKRLLFQKVGPALVLLVTFAVYWPALQNGFVWDDFGLVTGDPFIRSWRNIPAGWGERLFFDSHGSDFYRPLQRLSYTLDYTLYELAPSGYHLTNIILHGLAAVALGAVASGLFARSSRLAAVPPTIRTATAWVVAAIWVSHPALTSAVTYVSGRADSLAALFAFWAVFMALRSDSASANRPCATACGASTLCLLAAYSKEVGLISFVLVTATFVIFSGRRNQLVPWFVMAAIAVGSYAFCRLATSPPLSPNQTIVPLGDRALLMLRAIAEYAGLILAPLNLHMERGIKPPPEVIHGPTGLALAAAGGLLLLLLVFGGTRLWYDRAFRLALISGIVVYLPTSNILSLNAVVAEHWLYQPLFWLLAGLAITALPFLALQNPSRRALAGVGIAIWALFLGVRTWHRQFAWRDYGKFIENTIADGGDSARMWFNLGLSYTSTDPVRARDCFGRALAIAPQLSYPKLMLGELALREGDPATARRWLAPPSGVRMLEPRRLERMARLRRLEKSGRGYDEIKEAQALAPQSWFLKNREVEFLMEDGEPDRALKALSEYCADNSFRAESWLRLAQVARATGRAAIATYALGYAFETDVHLKRRLATQTVSAEPSTPPLAEP